MDMGHWDVGLVLGLTVRANCPEDQQAFALFEANPGGAIPLFREEALDVAQATPVALDQASEGWGKKKAAASSHETQGM
jgi:hypothetical protein